MEDKENLQRLDELVGKLLNAYNELQEENKNLTQDLQASQLEVVQLQEKLAGLRDEKTHVYERVAGILSVVEQWEKSHGSGAGTTAANDVVSEDVRQKEVQSSSSLFSMES